MSPQSIEWSKAPQLNKRGETLAISRPRPRNKPLKKKKKTLSLWLEVVHRPTQGRDLRSRGKEFAHRVIFPPFFKVPGVQAGINHTSFQEVSWLLPSPRETIMD